MDQLDVWKARVARRLATVRQQKDDLRRELLWRLGGRRFFSRYASELAGAHRWCFIVGCNNSGTSLLHRILENTGDVSTFELEGQRYTNVLVRAHRAGHERVWTEFLDELRMTASDGLELMPRLTHDWFEALELPLRPIIVEKTTANAVRMQWLAKAFPNSSFIGMVRNGYAVVEGIKRKGGKTAQRGAAHWKRVNDIMIEDSTDLERLLWLRYEDLVNQPHDSAQRVGAFLGIEPARIERAMEREYSFETVRGSGASPIRDLNADSIARLSEEERATVEQVAGDVLERFGYLRDDARGADTRGSRRTA